MVRYLIGLYWKSGVVECEGRGGADPHKKRRIMRGVGVGGGVGDGAKVGKGSTNPQSGS